MAKVAFSKLGLTKPVETKVVHMNGQAIEIKTYLPMKEKLDLIERVVNQTVDENNFYNPCKLEMISKIEIILAFTNITVTDKQKEDIYKLYDLMSNGLFTLVLPHIEATQDYKFISEGIQKTIESVYSFTNSIRGILTSITNDYENMEIDASKIQQALGDPESLELLKEVITKLG